MSIYDASKRRYLVREFGGPLVSQKQFKQWGVNPAILKPHAGSRMKTHDKDETKSRLPTKKHYQQQSQIFRKTTSNLTGTFKPTDPQDDLADSNQHHFQSKSFVLPRRAAGKVKLETIKEKRTSNARDRKSIVVN